MPGATLKWVLPVAAIAEAATGVALLIVPSLVGQLLLGEELTGQVLPIARVAGIALIGLGIACWPGPPVMGMLVYGAGVAIFLGWLGLWGETSGLLLWPAVALHVILTVLMLRGLKPQSTPRLPD